MAFEGVTRVFRETGAPPRFALRDVSFRLDRGTRVALLGPNGSGKSTLLRLAATLDRPTSGRVLVDGTDARVDGAAARRRVSWMGPDPALYDHLTVRENLAFAASFWGRGADVERAAADAGAGVLLDRPARALSRGERQRAALARALLGGDALLLDEPTTGLDEEGRASLLRALDERREGRAVLLATHDEALARACDRVLRLRDGRLEARA